jgi:hypothetical protein
MGELLFALGTFLVALTILFVFLRTHSDNANNDLAFQELERRADNAVDVLVTSQGVPASWETDPASVQVLGLASRSRVLSPEKVSAFVNSDHQFVRDTLNMPPHDYYFRLSYANGSLIAETGNISTTKQAVGIERIVTYNNESAILSFRMY